MTWFWLLLAVVAILGGVYAYFVWLEFRKRTLLKRYGVRVVAVVVQVNTDVFDPEKAWGTPPGQFIITFDPDVNEPKSYLQALAARMMALKGKHPSDPDERFVANLVTDETFYFWRRIKLPVRFTGGPEVCVVYLNVWKDAFPGRRLQDPWVECTATPGPDGAIEMTWALG